MEQTHNSKGISDYQEIKAKTTSAQKLIKRIKEHEAWLQTDAGKEWRERQLMEIEEELSALTNSVYLYESWYNEQNDKGYFVDSEDDTIIDFGRKHKGKRYREVYETDKDYVNWIKKLKRDDEPVKKNPKFRKFVDYIKAVSFFDKTL